VDVCQSVQHPAQRTRIYEAWGSTAIMISANLLRVTTRPFTSGEIEATIRRLVAPRNSETDMTHKGAVSCDSMGIVKANKKKARIADSRRKDA